MAVHVRTVHEAISLTGRAILAQKLWAPKYNITFFTVESVKFKKTEQELKAYDTPISKIITDNVAKDIQAMEDEKILKMVESLCEEQALKPGAT